MWNIFSYFCQDSAIYDAPWTALYMPYMHNRITVWRKAIVSSCTFETCIPFLELTICSLYLVSKKNCVLNSFSKKVDTSSAELMHLRTSSNFTCIIFLQTTVHSFYNYKINPYIFSSICIQSIIVYCLIIRFGIGVW